MEAVCGERIRIGLFGGCLCEGEGRCVISSYMYETEGAMCDDICVCE